MKHRARRLSLLLIAILAMVACASSGATSAPRGNSDAAARTAAEPSRTLAVAIRLEPATVATRPMRNVGVGLYLPARVFNAQIGILDEKGNAHPYLVESLPRLNTDNWRVFPDGRMETTYLLKPNLTWHDSSPLTSQDFVFGWRVYTAPGGQANLPPYRSIDEVVAIDDRTILIKWKQPYPDTSFTSGLNLELPPLPRQLLEASFQPDQLESFINHSYWTRDYVGLGPYRLDRWETGSFIEGSAFAGHALGRPKIDQLKLQFIGDNNTALANLMAGEVQLSDGTSLGLPQVGVLKQDWIPRGLGKVVLHPNQWRAAHFQMRPDVASPVSLQDARTRKALAHAVDKVPINDGLYNGDGVIADSMVVPFSPWGPAAERQILRYPFDLRQSDALMNQAGFTKGPDGSYASPTEGRFSFEVKTNAATDNEAEMQILTSLWRQAGFDAQDTVLAAAQAQDPQMRSIFPGMFINSQNNDESAVIGLTTDQIPRADNRWVGGNRSGYSNLDFDRLVESFTTSLVQSEREDLMARMVRVYTDESPSISLFFRTQAWAYSSDLTGPQLVTPETNMSWNIQDWRLR